MRTTLLLAALSCLAPVTANAASVWSFESGMMGWNVGGWPTPADGVTRTSALETVGDGAPAGAITDGSYALKIEHTPRAGWTELMTYSQDGAGDYVEDDLIANTTIELDIYVPASALAGSGAPEIAVRLNLFGSEAQSFQPLVAGSNHITYDYVDHAIWPLYVNAYNNPNVNTYAVINLTTRDESGTESFTPVYFDNIRLTNRNIPEPTCVTMLALGGVGLLASGRRRAG